MASHHYQLMFAQIGKMFGDGDLRRAEDALEVAHAQWPLCQEVQDAQPRFIAETAVDL